MAEQKEVHMCMNSWWPSWLDARAETPSNYAPELKWWNWNKLIETFGPRGTGVFFILLQVAHGRRTFSASVSDVLPLIVMSRAEFDEFTEQLEIAGLIATQPAPYGATYWTISDSHEWSAS
jgi:hypothetical protein